LSPGGRRRPDRPLERSAQSGVAAGCGFETEASKSHRLFLALALFAPKIGTPRTRKRSVSVLRENARGRTQIERLCAKMRAFVKNPQAPGKGAGRSWALSRRADRPKYY
jgi:hypothetical protein